MSERNEAIGRAVAAYRALAELAESVEDEWQYVTDLTEAYLPSLEALADGASVPPAALDAVDEAVAEVALISDPNRAIDWLSTFPHVVGLALGGDVDEPTGDGANDGAEREDDEPSDDDNPFRLLLGGGR